MCDKMIREGKNNPRAGILYLRSSQAANKEKKILERDYYGILFYIRVSVNLAFISF